MGLQTYYDRIVPFVSGHPMFGFAISDNRVWTSLAYHGLYITAFWFYSWATYPWDAWGELARYPPFFLLYLGAFDLTWT